MAEHCHGKHIELRIGRLDFYLVRTVPLSKCVP